MLFATLVQAGSSRRRRRWPLPPRASGKSCHLPPFARLRVDAVRKVERRPAPNEMAFERQDVQLREEEVEHQGTPLKKRHNREVRPLYVSHMRGAAQRRSSQLVDLPGHGCRGETAPHMSISRCRMRPSARVRPRLPNAPQLSTSPRHHCSLSHEMKRSTRPDTTQ